ncbi:MAG TPA: hypothetical protein PLN02_12950, partial [Azonexus sp.]|nr:hypothetical protein [Azonexus sp.]
RQADRAGARGKKRQEVILETSVDRFLSSCRRMNADLRACDTTPPLGDGATLPLARPDGRPALWLRRNSPAAEIFAGSFSLLLAGMSLPRRRFAPAIPSKRAIGRVQLRFQG